MSITKEFFLAGDTLPIGHYDLIGIWEHISKANPDTLVSSNPMLAFPKKPMSVYLMFNPFGKNISPTQFNAYTYKDSLNGAQFLSMDLSLTNNLKTFSQRLHLRSNTKVEFSRNAEKGIVNNPNGIVKTENCGISMPATKEVITSLPIHKLNTFKRIIERINKLDLFGEKSMAVICRVANEIESVNKIKLFNRILRDGFDSVQISSFKNNTKITADSQNKDKLLNSLKTGAYNMVIHRGSYADGTFQKINLLDTPTEQVKDVLNKFLRVQFPNVDELAICINTNTFKSVGSIIAEETKSDVIKIQDELMSTLADLDFILEYDYTGELGIKNLENKLPKFARDSFDYKVIRNFAYNFSLFPLENKPTQLLALLLQLQRKLEYVNIFGTKVHFPKQIPTDDIIKLYEYYLLVHSGTADLSGLEPAINWFVNKYKETNTHFSAKEFFLITLCRFLAHKENTSSLIHFDADDIYTQDLDSYFDNVFNRVPLLQNKNNLNVFFYILLQCLKKEDSVNPSSISSNPLT